MTPTLPYVTWRRLVAGYRRFGKLVGRAVQEDLARRGCTHSELRH